MWEREKSIHFWASESPRSPNAPLAGGRLMACIYEKINHFTCNSTLIYSASKFSEPEKCVKLDPTFLGDPKCPRHGTLTMLHSEGQLLLTVSRSRLHLLTLIGSPQENKRSDSGRIKSFTSNTETVSLPKLHKSKEQAKPCKSICSKRITFRHF